MAKASKTQEQKDADKAQRESPDGLKDQLAKLRAKESKLVADLAVKEHPELQASIETLVNFIQEADKATKAKSLGADANIAKQREKIQANIEMYENKIAALKESLDKADVDSINSQLEVQEGEAMEKLAKAYHSVAPEFEKVGVNVISLIPMLEPYMEQISEPVSA